MWLATMFLGKCTGGFSSWRIRWSNRMFYDGWIKFFDETYLFLAVCVGLNCYCFRWTSFGERFNSFFTLLLGLFILAYPFFIAIFYNLKRSLRRIQNRDESFLSRFGSAIDNLNFLRRGRIVLIYRPASVIRKLWLALIILYLRNSPVFCIFHVNF